jgi:acyl-CoA oxidase
LRADNGYLGLKGIKVPRDYLLQRYITVNRDGTYKEASKDAVKFGYGSMLNLRVILANSFIYIGITTTNLAYT